MWCGTSTNQRLGSTIPGWSCGPSRAPRRCKADLPASGVQVNRSAAGTPAPANSSPLWNTAQSTPCGCVRPCPMQRRHTKSALVSGANRTMRSPGPTVRRSRRRLRPKLRWEQWARMTGTGEGADFRAGRRCGRPVATDEPRWHIVCSRDQTRRPQWSASSPRLLETGFH